MYKVIKIGAREVALDSSAALPIRYTKIFHENFFKAVDALTKAGESIEYFDTVQKLTYVMAMQADKADFNALNESTFEEWLDGFSMMEMMDAVDDIVEVYTDSAKTASDPK